MGWKVNVILLTEHSDKMPSKFNLIRDAIFLVLLKQRLTIYQAAYNKQL